MHSAPVVIQAEQAGTPFVVDAAPPHGAAAAAADAGRAVTLDYGAQSHTRVADGARRPFWLDRMPRSAAVPVRTANVYPCGELTVARSLRNASTRPPERRYGPRFVSGTSPRGARIIRRAIMYRANAGSSAFVFVTFTSQEVRSDRAMRHAFGNLLMWLRKWWRGWDGWYVWVAEDQQRGVLHFHLLLDRRVPKQLLSRINRLWAKDYGMGPKSVHAVSMRHGGKAAASYMGKYLTKRPTAHAASMDADGRLSFRPWPISRHNGKPYARDRFLGNPYGMSAAARWATKPVVTFTAAAGAFAGLDDWHGVSVFFASPSEAESHLAAVLAGLSPPRPRQQRRRRPHGAAIHGKRSAHEGA